MARKIKAKLIMELRNQGMSRRAIPKTRHMFMSNVYEVFDLAEKCGITWDQVRGIDDAQVYGLLVMHTPQNNHSGSRVGANHAESNGF